MSLNTSDFEVCCINLPSREDRWEESLKEFEKLGIRPFRADAVKLNNPIEGCAISHFAVLGFCKKQDKHAMIFEDDVHFINNYLEIESYLHDLDNLDWDMFYFGGNICGKITKVSDRIGKLSHAQSTHAYCVNKRFIPTILEKRNLIGKHLDLIYTEDIIPYHNCYISIPMLATQRPSYSDIERKVVNYDWMEGRYNSNLYSSS